MPEHRQPRTRQQEHISIDFAAITLRQRYQLSIGTVVPRPTPW